MRLLTFFLASSLICFLAVSCRQDTATNNSQTNISTNKNTVNANTAALNTANANTLSPNNSTNSSQPPVYTYEVVNTYKHDSSAFTEGLFFQNGFLYESVGREEKSDLRKVELKSGEVKQRRKMDAKYFGEGTTALNGKVYQLTWQDGKCFVYDFNTFEPLSVLSYNGEGWGLTNDGTNLIMSDGSHQIKFIDPETFRVIRTISVFNEGKPQMRLNELEYIKGEIWANIWHSDDPNVLGKENYIVRLNPQDGKILGWIDLKGISQDDVDRDEENTLNGIAYDAATDRIFITGKQWRKLFEIKVKPKS